MHVCPSGLVFWLALICRGSVRSCTARPLAVAVRGRGGAATSHWPCGFAQPQLEDYRESGGGCVAHPVWRRLVPPRREHLEALATKENERLSTKRCGLMCRIRYHIRRIRRLSRRIRQGMNPTCRLLDVPPLSTARVHDLEPGGA